MSVDSIWRLFDMKADDVSRFELNAGSTEVDVGRLQTECWFDRSGCRSITNWMLVRPKWMSIDYKLNAGSTEVDVGRLQIRSCSTEVDAGRFQLNVVRHEVDVDRFNLNVDRPKVDPGCRPFQIECYSTRSRCRPVQIEHPNWFVYSLMRADWSTTKTTKFLTNQRWPPRSLIGPWVELRRSTHIGRFKLNFVCRVDVRCSNWMLFRFNWCRAMYFNRF